MVIADHIRIDCYASVLKRFMEDHPFAHFEVIMRSPFSWLNSVPHILSPSVSLLSASHKGLPFADYKVRFEREMFTNPEAIAKMRELGEASDHGIVFLVCGEKNSAECHRSLVKEYIIHLDAYLEKYTS